MLLLPGLGRTFGSSPNSPITDDNIIYRTMGNTGMRVPVISSGAIPVNNDNMAKAILKSGIVMVDTAHGYNKGKNEKVLGRLLKEFKREDFIIATKVHTPVDDDTGKPTAEATQKYFLDKFETSMERLGLDYVDIIYSHATSSKEAVLHEPTIEALKQIKKEGKARFTGISTHKNETACIEAAIASDFYDVILTAFNYQLPYHENLEAALKKAADKGMGIVAMKVFAGNYHDKENEKPVNKSAALKWALQHEYIHTSILTLRNFVDLQEYWGIMEDISLSREEKQDLDYDETQGGLFCPGCGDCTQSCKHHHPIPELMRAYMYTYGYHDLGKARETLSSLKLPADICTDCGICTAYCNKGFDIKGRIQDVIRVQDIPDEFLV